MTPYVLTQISFISLNLMSSAAIIHTRFSKAGLLPATDFVLPPKQSHLFVFFIQHENVFTQYQYLLTPEENERASRFIHVPDKQLYIASRVYTPLLLTLYSGCNVKIETHERNKPFIKNDGVRAHLHFNISHTEGLLLVGISRADIGVDAEVVRPEIYTGVIDECMSSAEKDLIEKSPDAARAFYSLWTQKESLLKADGIGLTDNLSQLEVYKGENIVHTNIPLRLTSYHITTFTIKNFVCSFCNTSGDFEKWKVFEGNPVISHL